MSRGRSNRGRVGFEKSGSTTAVNTETILPETKLRFRKTNLSHFHIGLCVEVPEGYLYSTSPEQPSLRSPSASVKN